MDKKGGFGAVKLYGNKVNRYLIDTQVFIWTIKEPEKLSKFAKKLISHPANLIYISYFSLLEIKLKNLSGKLDYPTNVLKLLGKLDMELIYPETKVLDTVKIYKPSNKDPYDNLLMATAINHNLEFITADKDILKTSANRLKTIAAS